MNDKAFERKVTRDIDHAKKDFNNLVDDGVVGLQRKYDQLADDIRKMVSETVTTLKKDVGSGLTQYNEKVQEGADRVPGDLGRKAAEYPWVTVTVSLVFGVLLGVLLKPGRRYID